MDTAMASPSPPEERVADEPATEMVHRTKIIQFLGRTTPIILQNDNGPCPLLAICNVLLLKNNLNLSADIAEVSQEKLLSLVAERLIDSNSNVDDKDAGFIENQQQNIADAIDLLPRLATGIDVNLKFTRIDDFEFTRECAIFDLLDIPLYHGWIVDPQDCDTANAIGLKSYNTLMGELVALETRNMASEQIENIEEDSVDFVAATTAALGVPSPCLSRGRSFDDDPPNAACDLDQLKKVDKEEESELLRAMKLSEAESLILENGTPSGSSNEHIESVTSSECVELKIPEPVILEHSEGCKETESQKKDLFEPSLSLGCNALSKSANEVVTFEEIPKETVGLKVELPNDSAQSTSQELENDIHVNDVETKIDVLVQNENVQSASLEKSAAPSCATHTIESTSGVEVLKASTSVSEIHKPESNQHDSDAIASSGLVKAGVDLDSSSGRRQDGDVPEVFSSSADDSEPIYEGEEHILESGTRIYEDREPMYEGEVILAKQGDKTSENYSEGKDQFSSTQGELIRNFLKNSANQLTIYGLFCLQDGLKERELCVFFRNNHFNTMFKFEGELYILATDQGYLNQPDLVWEKLNEVNGDTVFMTNNFKEFKVEENRANNSWDEQNVVASTTDYIASIDNSGNANSSFNSDLQLAIALQQQEFEQQPQQRNVQQHPVTNNSRLVTGPQVPRQSGRNSAVSSSRQESKSTKDKCKIM